VQRRVALALAHLCAPEDQRAIFIDNNGSNFATAENCTFSFPFYCMVFFMNSNSVPSRSRLAS
jgi:hypothetical protein